MSRGGTNFFLLLDIGVPPPDTAQTPGTLCVMLIEREYEFKLISLILTRKGCRKLYRVSEKQISKT
jgi:hypothetical protein